MQLFYFLLVVISLGCGSLPPTEHDPALAFLASAVMVGVWSILCHLGAVVIARYVRGEGMNPILGARWLEKQLEAFRWLSLCMVCLCLAGFGLAPALNTIPVLANSMFLQAIVLLTPGLVMLVATWTAEHSYGVSLKYCDAGIGGYVHAVTTAFRGGLAWLIAPVLLLLGLIDIVGMMPMRPELAGLIAVVTILVFVPVVLPTLIQHLFRTSRLDDETHQWINGVLSAAGVGPMKVMRWNTDGQAFNAVVAGFIRPFRVLLVSDRLLDELPREQISMVLLHEAAHIRRRHILLRVLAVMPAWLLATAVIRLLGDISWAPIIGTATGIATTMLVLHVVAIRSEFDADVQACKLAERISGDCPNVPSSYFQASQSLGDALLTVTADNEHARRATWLHPGVADRLGCMRRHRATPSNSTSNAGTIANPA